MVDNITIYTCHDYKNLSNWQIINDGVMGGKSKGFISMDSQGCCEFTGEISLENNGGFSMARSRINPLHLRSDYSSFSLQIKGDGRQYQFRVKPNLEQRHSYGYYFTTTGEWQQVLIPFEKLKPVFRGRQLDLPSYQGKDLQEVAFLTGKNAGPFILKIKELVII